MDWTFDELENVAGGALYGVATRDGERLLAGGNTYGAPYVCWAGTGEMMPHPDSAAGKRLRGLRRPWIGADRIYVPGEYGLLATSEDRGKTWTHVEVGGHHCMYRVREDPAGRLLATNDGGVFASDDGRSWSWDHRGGRFLGVCFTGSRAVFFGDRITIRERGEYRDVAGFSPRALLCGMARASSGVLILCGDGGQLYRSRDEGETWEELRAPRVDYEDCVELGDGVLVVGASGKMMFTDDDGDSWEDVEHPWGTTHLWSVYEGDAPGEVLLGAASGLLARVATDSAHDDLDDLD